MEARIDGGEDPAGASDVFFRNLLRELRDVQLLKITDRDSPTDAEFKRRFGDFVASFRAAGGSVEMRGA
jgi:hypothetical protein